MPFGVVLVIALGTPEALQGLDLHLQGLGRPPQLAGGGKAALVSGLALGRAGRKDHWPIGIAPIAKLAGPSAAVSREEKVFADLVRAAAGRAP